MPKYSQYDVPSKEICVNFGVGQPDTRKLPLTMIKDSLMKLSSILNENEVLQYGQISGYQRFRKVLADWLTKKYNKVEKDKMNEDELFVTNGITGALHLILSVYTCPGDVIFVEDPSYFLAINIFKECGLNVVPIKMECDGINTNDLETELEKYKTKRLAEEELSEAQ